MDQTHTPITEEGTTLMPVAKRRRWMKLAAFAVSAVIDLCLLIVLIVQFQYVSHIQPSIDKATPRPVAIVLGASVKTDGTPSDALRDRVLTAAELYKQGKVESILMSGDDGLFHLNEVKVMVATAREAGVPERAIQADGHGYRTYESCKRAKDVFHVDQAIIVTQRFHLGRALYLCNQLGINADGVAADLQPYVRIVFFWFRDLLSSLKAFSDVHFIAPKPPVSYTE